MTVCGNGAQVSQCSPLQAPFHISVIDSFSYVIDMLFIITHSLGGNIIVLLFSCYIGREKQLYPPPHAKALHIRSSSQASLRLRAQPLALIFLFLSAELR